MSVAIRTRRPIPLAPRARNFRRFGFHRKQRKRRLVLAQWNAQSRKPLTTPSDREIEFGSITSAAASSVRQQFWSTRPPATPRTARLISLMFSVDNGWQIPSDAPLQMTSRTYRPRPRWTPEAKPSGRDTVDNRYGQRFVLAFDPRVSPPKRYVIRFWRSPTR